MPLGHRATQQLWLAGLLLNFCLPERDQTMARLRPSGLECSCCAVILLTTVGRSGHSTLALGFGIMSVILFYFVLGWLWTFS